MNDFAEILVETLLYIWLIFFFFWIFVFGCAVGSFLNVVIYRLPRGKNLFWPSSRCGVCLKAIRKFDNIPLLGYWKLGGRCRDCKTPFSMRYFWIELVTGLLFCLIYIFEIGWNVPGYPQWPSGGFVHLTWGSFAPHSWELLIGHCIFAATLLVSTACLFDGELLPRSLVVFGTCTGFLWAVCYPWPEPIANPSFYTVGNRLPCDGSWETTPLRGPMPMSSSWATAPYSPRPGFVPWPVWGPLPEWLPPASVLLGLSTGVAGMLMGLLLVRLTNQLHRLIFGKELIGDTPGDVMLLSGGFLGWQLILVALSLLALTALICRISDDRRMGMIAVVGVVFTWLSWGYFGPMVRPWLFDPIGAGICVFGVFLGLTLVGFINHSPAESTSITGTTDDSLPG